MSDVRTVTIGAVEREITESDTVATLFERIDGPLEVTPQNTKLCRPYSHPETRPPREDEVISFGLDEVEDGDDLELYRVRKADRPAYEQELVTDGGTSVSEDDGENWMDTFLASGEKFEEENEDLEAILEGEIGFHTFFNAKGDDPTRGVQTAIYQGVYDRIEELHVDADIVEMNHGEVTPETVREETLEQISDFTYLGESIADSIGDRVEERVRKNMKRGDGE